LFAPDKDCASWPILPVKTGSPFNPHQGLGAGFTLNSYKKTETVNNVSDTDGILLFAKVFN
jgi:hypothetical protein